MNKKLLNDFLAKARRKYGQKFDYSHVVYVNSTTHIQILCPMHGVFSQTPKLHLRGIGCPKCGREQRASQDRKTTAQFVLDSQKTHGNTYDYSIAHYKNNHSKLEIICSIHGTFHQEPWAHINGSGCPSCGIQTNSVKRTKSQKEILKEFRKTHGKRYDYSKVNYNGAFKKVSIICKKHGEFTQTPDHHKRGVGCSKCSHALPKYNRSNSKEFINKSKLIHKTKYDYSKINYKNSTTKVSIGCKKHGLFYQSPFHHLHGEGCPRCTSRVSKVESAFLDYLQIPNHSDSRQRYIKEMDIHVDGIMDNIIYEFLGDYYHGNPAVFNPDDYNKICHRTYGELCERTFDRLQRLKDAGYTVKYIWENDWNKFRTGLDKVPNIITV